MKEVEVPVETVVEKEVIKEVPVEKTVIETVEVEKEVVKEVPVGKIVKVEKIVIETVEVPVEVIVEAPAKVSPAGPNIYTNQDTAILVLESGEVDYVFNPLGLERGFEDQVRDAEDLDLITNPSNNVRYLGFNMRKAPMNNLAFRQAVALVIDKEFVTSSILQGASVAAYAMVPPGNASGTTRMLASWERA